MLAIIRGRSSQARRVWLLAVTWVGVLVTGCQGPVRIDLPQDPAASVLEAAQRQRRETSAVTRFSVSEQARGAMIERRFDEASAGYEIYVGEALESSLRSLYRAALDGPRKSAGDPLWLRVLAVEADCARTIQALRVSLRVTLVSAIGERTLGETVALGAGVVATEEGWFSTVDDQIEAAFAQAFEQVHRAALRFLAQLELPAAALGAVVPSRRVDAVESRDRRVGAGEQGPSHVRPVPPGPSRHGSVDTADVDARLSVGDLVGAHEAATALIKRTPDSAGAFQRRGAIRLALGESDAALADCFRALELDPNLARAYVTRANVYARRGDSDRAREDCEAALRLPLEPVLEESVRQMLEGLGGGPAPQRAPPDAGHERGQGDRHADSNGLR